MIATDLIHLHGYITDLPRDASTAPLTRGVSRDSGAPPCYPVNRRCVWEHMENPKQSRGALVSFKRMLESGVRVESGASPVLPS